MQPKHPSDTRRVAGWSHAAARSSETLVMVARSSEALEKNDSRSVGTRVLQRTLCGRRT